MPEKRKRNRRNLSKFPALKQSLNLKTRSQELDFDYIHKLNDKEKAWLNAFVEEEIHANLTHGGRKLNRLKRDRLRIYNRNNARNRDILTRCQASGMTVPLDELKYDDYQQKDVLPVNFELEKAVYKIDQDRKEAKRKPRKARITTVAGK